MKINALKILLSTLAFAFFYTNSISAQVIDEVTVTSPRISYGGGLGDFQQLINQINSDLRGFDFQGDIDDMDKQEDYCDLDNQQKLLRCEAQVLAALVGRVQANCSGYLAVPSTQSEAEIGAMGTQTRTTITTAQGIEIYDRCVQQADRVVDSQLKICSADFHKVNCAPNGR